MDYNFLFINNSKFKKKRFKIEKIKKIYYLLYFMAQKV